MSDAIIIPPPCYICIILIAKFGRVRLRESSKMTCIAKLSAASIPNVCDAELPKRVDRDDRDRPIYVARGELSCIHFAVANNGSSPSTGPMTWMPKGNPLDENPAG